MTNLIELKLMATPAQMRDIADVMTGVYNQKCPGDCGAGAKQIADLDSAAVAELQEQTGDDVPSPPATTEDEPPDPKLAPTAGEQSTPAVAETQTTTVQAVAHVADNTPPPPAGVTLDSAGLPWDARIHASTKTTKADGTWKVKRNTPAETIAEVETELRAAMTATPPPATTESSPAAALAAATTAGDDVPPPPVTTESASPKTFPELLPLVSAAKANGTITDDQIAVAVAGVGLTKFGELAVRPDLIPAFAEAVGV